MSHNTPTNAQSKRSNVPALRSFEFDKKAIGKIKSSVNKFRGTVSLPMEFLTLPGRENLDVKISAIYSSNIKKSMSTWNIDAPTGTMGIGWSMPFEKIIVNKSGSVSDSSDTMYLISSGSANPMIKTGETFDGNWNYQLRNHKFWSIQYNPGKKIWIIIKENGFTYTYGAGDNTESNATQWGISCGNWIGSTNSGSTQKQYALEWNLASIKSPLGNKVEYQYKNVNKKLINSTLEYTQASYLEKVIDSYGRTITFTYGEKYGDLNPDPDGNRMAIEYHAKHTQVKPPSLNAYQDRIETMFLDHVEVVDAFGNFLTGLKFTYDFFNQGKPGLNNYKLMYKRSLQSVFQYDEYGNTLPTMEFEYCSTVDSTVKNPGALKSVHYPEGGTASFEYKTQPINSVNSSKKVSINNPLAGSTPKTWVGSNYIILTYQDANQIKIISQAWNGQWVTQNLPNINKPAAADSISVLPYENYFAISFRNTQTGNDELYLYRNDDRGTDYQFGQWKLYNNQPFRINVNQGSNTKSMFVGGDNFVVAYNKDYAGNKVQGFSYNWKTAIWNGSIHPPVPPNQDCDVASITAMQNFYITSCYLKDSKQLKNYMFYLTSDGIWKSNNPWTINNIDIIIDDKTDNPYLSLQIMPTSVAMTYATKLSNSAIDYSLMVFNWNEQFNVINTSSYPQIDLSTSIKDNNSVYKIFQTQIVQSTLNNNLALLRNEGGDQTNKSSWKQKKFTNPGDDIAIDCATGVDVSILSPKSGSTKNQLASFNPNTGSWIISTGQAGSTPSISGNYMTVGNDLYFRNTDQVWKKLPQQLSNFGAPESLQNRGPHFIAYQNSSDSNANTYVIPLKNGEAGSVKQLSGTKIHLASSRFIITYPSSADTFEGSPSIDIWNVDEVNFDHILNDTPVATIVIENKFDPTQNFAQSFYYANSPESQIVKDALNGVTQYPKVTVVEGIKNKEITQPAAPEGYTQYFFSNGLAKQTTLYPSGGTQNYQNILNGIKLGQKVYDKDNNLVSSTLDYWKVMNRDGNGANLYGAYAKLERSVHSVDGVEQFTNARYDKNTGLLEFQEKSYYDGNGNLKVIREENLFAYQVPAYATYFTAKHNFSAIAMKTNSVTILDGTTTNYTNSQATIFKNWGDASNPCFAPVEILNWKTPGTIAPTFPSNKNERANWQLKSTIISKSKNKTLITEEQSASGLCSSFIYDESESFLVAKFPNGSLAGNEVSYYGFEKYEDTQSWSMGSGASIIPNNSNPTIDAHTGTNSLMVAPNTTGKKSITNSFTPRRQDQQYVFSCWIKKPSDFKLASGDAFWKISVSGGKNYILHSGTELGKWCYISQLIDLSGGSGSSTISVELENKNQTQPVLVDNLRFTPLSCTFIAYSFKNRLDHPIAVLGANGECSRKVSNSFEQEIVTTNAADRTAKIKSPFLSRSGNQGSFSIENPNHTLSMTATNGGQLTQFSRGNEWCSTWNAAQNVWTSKDAKLTQKTTQLSGELQYIGKNKDGNYALDISLRAMENITTPMGIKLGTNLKIQWHPGTTSWECIDASGTAIQPAVDNRIFSLDQNPFTGILAAATVNYQLIDVFAKAGFLLTKDATINSVGSGSKEWIISSANKSYTYNLKVIANQIAVYKSHSRWTLFSSHNTIAFWVDGKTIFSHTSKNPIDATPTLFFGNKVAISQITMAINPMAQIKFDDSRGNNIQLQEFAEKKMIINNAISDNIGRIAVSTKKAYISAVQNPMFKFCPNFAKMDWTAGTMSGLIDEAFPNDHGYPFSRSEFEHSPLSRITKQSVPGQVFNISGDKCTSYSYSAHKDDSGTGIYFQKLVTNPNGDQFSELTSLRKKIIQKVSLTGPTIKNETYFDDAGNATIVRPPNYFNPPKNSQADDWVNVQTFDYLNQLTEIKQGQVVTNKIVYDLNGKVRFSQTAQGAKDGTYSYFKYDILSRTLEQGFFTGAWDVSQLQNWANGEPAQPTNVQTWRKKNLYDIGQEGSFSIGRITEVLANNSDQGQADVTEHISHNIFGKITSNSLLVNDFGKGTPKEVGYVYNDIGTITTIHYPESESPYAISYEINSLNQITAIKEQKGKQGPNGIKENIISTFSYYASGAPLENQLVLHNKAEIKQQYRFNSPEWLLGITNENGQGTKGFSEALTYTKGGYKGAGYFDGMIASATMEMEGTTPTTDKFQYSHDSMSQILNACNPNDSSQNMGVKKPIAYDANGNISNIAFGDNPYTYNYEKSTQRVSEIIDDSNNQQIGNFVYNDNGNTISLQTTQSNISKAMDLSFNYDPATMLPTEVTNNIPNGASLKLSFGGRGERVMKEIDGGTSPGKKLYVRGTSQLPIQEVFIPENGTSKTIVNYIYGPGGLIAMRREETTSSFYHILKDHLGSTKAILDHSGNLVASYKYLTNGVLSEVNEPSPGFMPYLFTGQEYDAEIGLYNYRVRFYFAEIGRFLSIDPAHQFFSPYIYASNNPVLYVDPTGMFSLKSFFSAIGGIIIGAVEILIGVVIDVIAAVAEVITGGLSTPATIGLGALSGIFYGAGVSAISYSVFHFNSFSWKDYGISMGFGAAGGAVSGAISAGIPIVAAAANAGVKTFTAGLMATGDNIIAAGNAVGGTVLKIGAKAIGSVGETVTGWGMAQPITAGWRGLAAGLAKGIVKSEVIGISINEAKNLYHGDVWYTGLGQTIFSSALSGSISGTQIKPRTEGVLT